MATKNWKNIGEVTKSDRPINSLLTSKIDFKQKAPLSSISAEAEDELRILVKHRIKEKNYDNFKPVIKTNDVFEKTEIVDDDVEYEEDMSKEEMIELFWKIDNELSKICDFSNFCALGVEKNEKKIFDEKKVSNKVKDAKVLKNLAKNKNVRIIK